MLICDELKKIMFHAVHLEHLILLFFGEFFEFQKLSRSIKPGIKLKIFALNKRWSDTHWEVVKTRAYPLKEKHHRLLSIFFKPEKLTEISV